jgi:Zn-dependent M32 family carboxypeptidase
MGRNEIRLRRNRLTSRGSDRFRNYGAVMEQHEKEMRLKKLLRVFTTLLVILVLIALLFFITQVERKASEKKSFHTEKFIKLNT